MDVIIILGALIGRDGYPGRVARFRLQHALPIIVETLPDSWVLISGGFLPGRPVSEARAMGDWAVQQALKHYGEAPSRDLEQRLLTEEVSLSTAESAHYTAVMMEARGLKTAGLITDHLHMARAAYLFKRSFSPRQLEIRPLPARGLLQDYWRRGRYLRLSKFVLREAGAWVKVWGRKISRKNPFEHID
jgi:uncharacterized SAM-binding protein YcdF (DUF218 family)